MADQRVQIRLIKSLNRFPDGLTSNELAAKMKLPLTAVRRMIQTLKVDGLLVNTGEMRIVGKPPYARPAIVWTTLRHAQQKTAAPEGTAEFPDSGATMMAVAARSGQQSNNGPGPQEAGHGEQLICPQEFAAGHGDQNPSNDRSADQAGDTQPHALWP